MTEIEWWDFDNSEEMVDAVAGDIQFIIESALDARGSAVIAFPGGNTPMPIFDKLASAPIKWKYVTIIPTDDRLVAVDDALSNIAKIAKIFLPLGARVVPFTSEAADYNLAGSAADARLQDMAWPLDLVWLGMGLDGHTASIFPGPDMESALDVKDERRAIGVQPDPMPDNAPVNRVTLTANAIASARTVMVTIEGMDKRSVLERAIELGSASDVPIGRVFGALSVPVDIYCLDK